MDHIRKLIREAIKRHNVISEKYASASDLYQINGVLVVDTNVAFQRQIMSDIRAIKGVTIIRDQIYEPVGAPPDREYSFIHVKIDPAPFEGGVNEEVVNQIIKSIKEVKGVVAFRQKGSIEKISV
jgi:hypothetical protein